MIRIACIYYTWKKVDPAKVFQQSNVPDDDENNGLVLHGVSNLDAMFLFIKKCLAKERICLIVAPPN